MSEFSNQSIALAQNLPVKITQQQWEELAQMCGLSPSVLYKVQDRWIQDGDDGARFLEKIDSNYYILGPTYKKTSAFLKQQGLRRIENSRIAKQAIAKRNKLFKRDS